MTNRVKVTTEGKGECGNRVVWLDDKVYARVGLYNDYAYHEADNIAGELRVKIQRGEV